ncbi:MAG: translation elongation factor 4 [Candidatus Fimenecus sp.]
MPNKKDLIRNFCIIAHIDHGKSTLADRLLELTESVPQREMREQLLDNMDIEREHGITIKLRAVRLDYKAEDGNTYHFNLIDTPGHVDFSYEVSRSLQACEGAVLIVDASQGIEAQTLANTYLALGQDLELVPVINKIDLPAAEPDRVAREIEDVIGISGMDAPRISAKTGINCRAVLEKIVQDIPAPPNNDEKPLRALIFDSIYDSYKGVIVFVRIVDGLLKKGDRIKLCATGAEYETVEIGYMRAKTYEARDELRSGEVGYITASIKTVSDASVGDTITLAEKPCETALEGYRRANPMVYCGMYPADGADYEALSEALQKLTLNDAALSFEPETSSALGFGFRCGFLGLLHLEVISERLEREFDLELINTVPSVIYRIHRTDGSVSEISNPADWPDPTTLDFCEEPMADVHIISPKDYVGTIMDICTKRRGEYKGMDYLDERMVNMSYVMPLNEIIYDFFDTLKASTRGYASYDYELCGYQKSTLQKLDVLLNGDKIDALSFIVHESNSQSRARKIAVKLKDNIPRQMFEIPVQVAAGGRIIARETVKAMRKDVLAKCYGGDISRKKKLLEKQKEGKKKMRKFGSVEVPKEAFLAVLKADNEE